MRFAPLLVLVACADTFVLYEKDDADDDSDAAAPDIQVGAAFVDFATVPPGCDSSPELVEITNVGTAALQLGDVEVAGASRRAFALTQPLKSLAPGETTTMRITFTPADLGSYADATLRIPSNDPDEAVVEIALAGEGANEATANDTFTQASPAGVDLVVVVDTSTSMDQDIEDLQVHFATFINRFLTLGLDFHIAVLPIDHECPTFVGPVITTATPDPTTAFHDLLDSPMCDDNETTFDMLTAAFTPPHLTGANKNFLRADANLAVVVFSDEPEQSGELLSPYEPSAFVRFLRSLKGGDASKVTFSGLVGPEGVGGAANCLVRGNPALWNDRYQRAIRQTGGYVGNICDVRVQPFLRLLERTATGLTYSFELLHTPSDTDTSGWTLTVDGATVRDGWSYDAATNTIEFETDAVPPPGAEIVVAYPYASDGCE